MTGEINMTGRDVYRLLMQQVMERLSFIEKYLEHPVTELVPTEMIFEMCYLQLRMVCETVAQACLVAHGDIVLTPESQDLLRQWNAGKIMKSLTKLHPDFFPRAIELSEGMLITPENLPPTSKEDHLTKADFFTLYGQCGSALHRGSLDKVFSRRTWYDEREKVVIWTNKIVALINFHWITNRGGEHHWFCTLDGGQVRVHLVTEQRGAPTQRIGLRDDRTKRSRPSNQGDIRNKQTKLKRTIPLPNDSTFVRAGELIGPLFEGSGTDDLICSGCDYIVSRGMSAADIGQTMSAASRLIVACTCGAFNQILPLT